MNNNRRNELDKVIALLEEVKEKLEAIKEEEQETYDNMPESFQESDRGQISQEAIDQIESAISDLEGAIDYATNAKG